MAQDSALEEEVFTGRIDVSVWQKILGFASPYRGYLLALSMLGIFTGIFDMAFPLITSWIIDGLATQQKSGGSAPLWRYFIIYGITCILFALTIFSFIIVAGKITVKVSHDIRRDSFAKLQELPFSFYDRKAVGWLMARLTSDCNSLSRVVGWALLDIAWGISVISMVTGAMFLLNWKVAICVLLITPALAIASRYFSVRLLLTSRALRKANSQTTAAFNEGIVGVRTSKSMVREEQNLAEFSHLADTMYTHAYANGLYSAMFLPIVLSLCSIGVGLALWRGGIQVSVGTLTIGQLIAFIQYATFLQHPAQELANTITMIQGAQASAERVQGLLDTDPEIKDGADAIELSGPLKTIDTIEFRDVTFAYKAGQTVLREFNLTVRAGETIALVGPTGGGKSTIVGLACRFYEPTSGAVLINGIDYRTIKLKSLQSNLGMVLQQPHLFSGTIRENIRYGRLDATDAQIEEAAKLTNAHDFIMHTDKGYDAQVGEGGVTLSTGQKQLIALARAIIANPQIFVMDEATSSVDTHTEKAIQDAVDRVVKDRISFVIAHRLSTIKSADRILLIAGGKIVEEGSHHDLLAQRGRYYELYTNQFTHEREDEMLNYATA